MLTTRGDENKRRERWAGMGAWQVQTVQSEKLNRGSLVKVSVWHMNPCRVNLKAGITNHLVFLLKSDS